MPVEIEDTDFKTSGEPTLEHEPLGITEVGDTCDRTDKLTFPSKKKSSANCTADPTPIYAEKH